MVAILPAISVGLTVATAAAFFLYPRVPRYFFQIQSVTPRWFPESGFLAQLSVQISWKNENHIAMDIHAVSFDLYYPDWSGKIQWLGNVQDVRLREQIHHRNLHQDDQMVVNNVSPYRGSTETVAAKSSANTPLWKLDARQQLETHNQVFMASMGGLGVMGNFAWDMIQNYGILEVLSTGAIHIKASGQIPMTLTIFCDNVLNMWTLEMTGVHCELDKLDMGWKDIPMAMESLRFQLAHHVLNCKVQLTNMGLLLGTTVLYCTKGNLFFLPIKGYQQLPATTVGPFGAFPN